MNSAHINKTKTNEHYRNYNSSNTYKGNNHFENKMKDSKSGPEYFKNNYEGKWFVDPNLAENEYDARQSSEVNKAQQYNYQKAKIEEENILISTY